jgi:hypothetical protein
MEERNKSMGLRELPEPSAEVMGRAVIAQASQRESLGLPPLVIIPRPYVSNKDEKFVIERY